MARIEKQINKEEFKMDNVFEMISVTEEQVVLKVHADDNLTIAMHPYLQQRYDYITLTRGDNHTLIIIYKDGNSFSFDFGLRGYTEVSDRLKKLKREVCKFIEANGIHIPYQGMGDHGYN